jgi:hypothetical protein
MTLPDLDAWSEGKELWFGGAVFVVVLLSYFAGKHLAHDRPAPDRPAHH